MRRYTVAVVTDAEGDAVVFTPRVRGAVHSITYVKDDYEDGVDFEITDELTGETIWAEEAVNSGKTVLTRAPTHTQAGAAAIYAADAPVLAPVAVSASRIKIVVADGGEEKSGVFHILIA